MLDGVGVKHSFSNGNYSDKVRNWIKHNKVVMFSKSWCPFCKMAKKLFNENGLVDYKLVELDELGQEGDAI